MAEVRPTAVGRWRLDVPGSVRPPGVVDRGPSLALGGGAAITSTPLAIGSGALDLGSSGGYAATSEPVVDTSGSFTATMWVAAPARPQTPATVLALQGAYGSAITVRYVPDATDPADMGSWRLDVPAADQAGVVVTTVENPAALIEDWDHLAVVYDAFKNKITLYVNGSAEPSADGTQVPYQAQIAPFTPTASMQLGRVKTPGSSPASYSQYWPGLIDDVWMFRGAATECQVQAMSSGMELTTDYSFAGC